MQIVHTDLDNTLIYSYKHEIGGPKTCVEIYQGREISFMTETSHRLLGQLCSKPGVLVVPTTTRTLEQYELPQTGNFKEKTENKIQNEEKKIFSDQILAYLLECLS